MNTTEIISRDVAEALLRKTEESNGTGVIGSPSLVLGWTLGAALSVVRRGTSFKLTRHLGQRKLEIITTQGVNNFYVLEDSELS